MIDWTRPAAAVSEKFEDFPLEEVLSSFSNDEAALVEVRR